MEKRKDRVFYYDAIRVVACLSVIIIHFNASFSAWSGGVFTYPNAVFPNFIFNQSVYLGDFGVSLFFILSGAAMFRTYGGREISLGAFYRKRFLSLYPMFWLAWFAATAVGVLVYGGIGSGGAKALLATFSGMDGYLLSLGYGGLGAFYKVGEWFLGCMILLYLMMPLLLQGMKKHPLLTLGLSVTVSILIHGETSNIFFLRRVPEVVFGMAFDRYFCPRHGKARTLWAGGTLAGILALSTVGPKLVSAGYGLEACVGICALTFLLLALLFQNARNAKLIRPVSWIARYSYPIFLIHHQVCDYMSTRFYLPDLPRRTLYFAFFVYLVITALLAVLLVRTSRGLMGLLKSCFSTGGAATDKFSGALAPGTEKPSLSGIALFGRYDEAPKKSVLSDNESVENRIGEKIVCINTVIAIYIFAVTEILSAFTILTRRNVLISWAAFLLCNICALLFIRKISVSHIKKRLTISLHKQKTATAQIAIALGLVLILGFLSWKIVPYNADSMAYHCARILHWIQNRSVDYYPTNIFTQLYSPPMAEYVVMQTYFLWGSDVAFNLVQWYAYILDAAMIYFICRKLNVQRELALVGSILMMTMPIAIAESSTTQVDLFSGVWLLFFVYLAIDFSKYKEIRWTRKQILEAILAGSIAGIGYISKSPICVQMFFIAIWLLAVRLFKKDKAINLLGFAGIAGMSAIPFVLPSLIRNYKFAGDIFASNYFSTIAIGTWTPKYVLLNIIKNWAQTSVTHTSVAVNTYIQEFVHSFADAICVDLNDPLITYSADFDACFSPSYHCDVAPAPAVGIGLLIAIIIGALLTVYCIASKRKLPGHFNLEVILLLAILSGFALIRWQGWVTRLLLPTYMLSTIYIILIFDDLFGFFSINGLKSAFSIALPAVLLYTSLGAINYSVQNYERCIDTGNRMEMYFLDRPWHYQPYDEIMSYVKEKNYSKVGLWMQAWHYEYPLQVGLENETTQLVQVVPDAPNKVKQLDCIVSIEMQNFSIGDMFEYCGDQYICTYLCESNSAFAVLEPV